MNDADVRDPAEDLFAEGALIIEMDAEEAKAIWPASDASRIAATLASGRPVLIKPPHGSGGKRLPPIPPMALNTLYAVSWGFSLSVLALALGYDSLPVAVATTIFGTICAAIVLCWLDKRATKNNLLER